MILRKFDDIADAFILNASRKSWIIYAVVLVLTATLFLFGLFDMPPMDRDETRFAQATKQMLETHNYIDIRFGEEVRYKKPVGIYWLQALAVSFFSEETAYNQIGYYRIPSVVGGLIAVLATIAMTRRLFGREAAVLAGLLAPLPILVSIEAHLAKTDSVMVACTALSLYALSCLWRLNALNNPSRFTLRHFLIFWVSLGIGVLVKGVNLAIIIPAIIALCVVRKDIKWLSPLKIQYGIILLGCIVLPWVLMIQHISDGQFLRDSAGGDFLTKIMSGVESHGYPPLAYLFSHFAVFWPVSLLSPFAFWIMWKNKHLNDGYAFVLAILVPVWIMFEIVPTKLPHYTYPLYSLLIAGIGGVCVQLIHDNYDILRGKMLFIFGSVYLLISAVLAIALPVALYHFEHYVDLPTSILSGLSVIFAILAVIKLRLGLVHGVVVLLTLQALTILPNGFSRVMPAINAFNLASQMNDMIDDTGCSRNAVFVSGYNEPSVMFKIGTQTHFASTQALIEKYKTATPCSLFFIGENHAMFQKAFENTDTFPLMTVNGFRLNGGDDIVLYLYKR